MPHTPWPLVQPEPKRVPRPTSRPATASSAGVWSIWAGGMACIASQTSGAANRPSQEGQAPADVAARRAQQAADDAADAGDAAVGEQQQGRTQADQQAAGERCQRGEVSPVDVHAHLL
jgi:hypothetical protein